MWTGFERPTKLYVGSDNVMYVAELEDRVSIVDLEGNVLGRFGSERSHDPGKFWGPHGIWTDSIGDHVRGRSAGRALACRSSPGWK